MGIGNTNTAGGALNFKVVGGTTQPNSPRENTIWVNTANNITGWYFSARKPENLAEGEVWFATGASSDVGFNALKKNDVHIYPVKATQYVNGELKDVTAKFYQGGEWNLLVHEFYLYNNGTFADADGGLKQAGVPYGGGGTGSCKITVNESTVTINTEAGSAALVYFPKKYDLTNYNTLYFNGSFQKGSNGDGKCGVGVWKTIPSSDAAAAASAILEDFSQEDTYAIDISKVTGEHYVGIVVWGFGAGYAATATMKQMYLK